MVNTQAKRLKCTFIFKILHLSKTYFINIFSNDLIIQKIYFLYKHAQYKRDTELIYYMTKQT